MLKAVLRQGVIVPLEPLPREWEDGTALEVAKAQVVRQKHRRLGQRHESNVRDSSRADEATIRRPIEEQRQQAKAQVRREMRQSNR